MTGANTHRGRAGRSMSPFGRRWSFNAPFRPLALTSGLILMECLCITPHNRQSHKQELSSDKLGGKTAFGTNIGTCFPLQEILHCS